MKLYYVYIQNPQKKLFSEIRFSCFYGLEDAQNACPPYCQWINEPGQRSDYSLHCDVTSPTRLGDLFVSHTWLCNMSSSESEFSTSISSTSSFLSAQDTLELFPDWELSDCEDNLYDNSLEPVATAEESTARTEQVAKEELEETEFFKRFNAEVEIQTW